MFITFIEQSHNDQFIFLSFNNLKFIFSTSTAFHKVFNVFKNKSHI